MKHREILRLESDYLDCSRIQDYILDWCRKSVLPASMDKHGNITVRKGTGKGPCVVAHMDTVHSVTGRGLRLVQKGNIIRAVDPVTNKPAGIGGDDKCGIIAALNILEHAKGDGMAVFTVQEELGCVGARRYNKHQIRHCSFLMQADRRGNKDAVFAALDWPIASISFEQAVMRFAKRFGYRPCYTGSITDVQEFVHGGLPISAVNLSAGYYYPHTRYEFVNLADLQNCIKLMTTLWEKLNKKQWRI